MEVYAIESVLYCVLTEWRFVVGWESVVAIIDILSTDNSNPLNADLY